MTWIENIATQRGGHMRHWPDHHLPTPMSPKAAAWLGAQVPQFSDRAGRHCALRLAAAQWTLFDALIRGRFISQASLASRRAKKRHAGQDDAAGLTMRRRLLLRAKTV